jgi:hypothetical protein
VLAEADVGAAAVTHDNRDKHLDPEREDRDSKPPKTHNGDLASLPAALLPLTKERRWVDWKWVLREDERTGRKKMTKPPFQPCDPTRYARTNDPSTWDAYGEALKRWEDRDADGIGYMLLDGVIAAVDLDKCVRFDPGTRKYHIEPWAKELIAKARGAYCEVTPSGEGLRVIGRAKGSEVHRRFSRDDGGAIELYRDTPRFITITGLQQGECDELPYVDDFIDELHALYDGRRKRGATDDPAAEQALPDVPTLLRLGVPEGQRSEAVHKVVCHFLAYRWPIESIAAEIEKSPLAARYPNGKGLRDDVARIAQKWAADKPHLKKIDELATLDPMAYELRRTEAAKDMGIRRSALDEAVVARRAQMRPEEPDERLDEPWPHRVNGAGLLYDLCKMFERHLVLPKYGAEALALSTLHAHAHDAARHSPILAIDAPDSDCGKTTTLKCVMRVVPKPLMASSITPAAVFRVIASRRPTLGIDEADASVPNNEAFRQILDSCHDRETAYVWRCEGDDNEPRQFSTWAPVITAGIQLKQRLHSTLLSRCILISMVRKKFTDPAEELPIDPNCYRDLRRRCARLAADNSEHLRHAKPDLSEIINRARDNWRPLIAIADLAGGEWPKLARKAAAYISRETSHQSFGEQLLSDLRDLFLGKGHFEGEKPAKELSSNDIVDKLKSMEDRPWAEFKRGQPITQAQLAAELKPYKVHPRPIRTDGRQKRGYSLQHLKLLFDRYLSAKEGDEGVTPSQRQ